MLSGVRKTASACWRPVVRKYVRMTNNNSSNRSGNDGSDDGNDSDHDDGSEHVRKLMWSRDIEKHFIGEFSFAVYQANEVIEDYSQVEVGCNATFVGVYDGHGGPDASRFLSDHLFKHLIRHARDHGDVSEDVIRSALSSTEDAFLTLVSRTYRLKPLIAAIGSCCLVGCIWGGTLYVANLGDSRAVIGFTNRSNKIIAQQLTKEHNACMEEVREELWSAHPDDSSILVQKQGVWRIKGIIQVSRSIGDAYLKRTDLVMDPTFPRFHFSEPIRRPVLTADPSVYTRVLQPNDQFVIFASDGLWELLTNQEAVEIVHNNPRTGIAKRLVKKALKKLARKMNIKYEDLKNVDKGERRKYHDDITVVVLFLNHELVGATNTPPVPELSIKGFVDSAGLSNFSSLREAR